MAPQDTDVCDSVVVIDFETTGLSGQRDRIIEIGAVALDGNQCVAKYSQLLNPGDFLPAQITAITGITDEMLSDCPRPEDVMPSLRRFLGSRTLIAHNAAFDYRFLTSEMNRAELVVSNPILCTLKLARRLIPGLSSYSLGCLKDYLGIHVARSHRALDDALATAYVWRHLYGLVLDRLGEKNLGINLMLEIMKSPKHRIDQILAT